ncbi:MAG: alanine racemase [Synechococcaceae cyanobacterium]|nr:alanine racemase [Synechococcaceae cyanobacterium]
MVLPSPTDLAVLLNGVLRGDPAPGPPRGVRIDSRRVSAGDLFFALSGRQHDGHAFAAAALEAGAALVVVRRGWSDSAAAAGAGPALEVDDPLAALQTLAAWYRRLHIGRVVAITGSNGKTVVKNALTALLAGRWRVAASPGSWNSQVGVPLAVLSAPAGTEIGVFEAGVSAPGEMERIAAILQPDHGILVNIGLAHIAGFGHREVTAREKLRLFRDLPPQAWLILPDDPLLAGLPLACRRLRPGLEDPRELERRACAVGTALTLDFGGRIETLTVRTRSGPLLDDLVIAITAARRLEVDVDAVLAALADHRFGPTRMETWRTPEGITIVNDTASDDPLSVQAALEAVAASPTEAGRRLFIFGGMNELGDRQAGEHALIGRLAAERGFSELLLLPHPARGHTAAAWQAARPGSPPRLLADNVELRETLRGLARRGDTLLFKGPARQGLAAAASAIWESMAPRRFLVDLDAIRGNIARFRALCGPDVAILAVLKAWAYGSDLGRMAVALQESGVDWIGVSAADEGATLRREGIHLPILVLLMDGAEVDKAVRWRLTPVVYSLAFARTLIDSLRESQASCDVHLEIDSGMGRLGVAPHEALAAARLLRGSGVTRLTGLMTHLASADDPSADADTQAQLQRFEDAVAAIRAEADAEAPPLLLHAAATSGAVRFPQARYAMVRLGLGLYGIHPSAAVAEAMELNLAVAFVSRLAQVAVWPRGQRIGYSGTYAIEAEQQRVGIVAVGYNDGVPWRSSNRGEVIVLGRRVRVLGRVSMDSMAVDLDPVPEAAVGDEVLILGAHEGQELRPEAVAEQAGTIPYELLVNIDSRRVQRLFRGDGAGTADPSGKLARPLERWLSG